MIFFLPWCPFASLFIYLWTVNNNNFAVLFFSIWFFRRREKDLEALFWSINNYYHHHHLHLHCRHQNKSINIDSCKLISLIEQETNKTRLFMSIGKWMSVCMRFFHLILTSNVKAKICSIVLQIFIWMNKSHNWMTFDQTTLGHFRSNWLSKTRFMIDESFSFRFSSHLSDFSIPSIRRWSNIAYISVELFDDV